MGALPPAAEGAGRSEHGQRQRGVVGMNDQERYDGQRPLMRGLEGGRQGGLTGQDLLEEVFDLIRRRLPLLADDDPVRGSLSATLTALAPELGRPRVMPVPEDRLAQRS